MLLLKHDLLVLKDTAVTKACSWWDKERERSSPSVTSAGSSEVSKAFHMTKRLGCSCSWISEITTVQTEFVAKCLMRNHTPSVFNSASRCFLIYPLQTREVFAGPWALGKSTSVNSSVYVQTTAAVAPLFPFKWCHGRRDSQLDMHPKAHTALDLLVFS